MDNRSKRKREKGKLLQDFSSFAQQRREHTSQISPQLALATYQFLSTSIEPFKSEWISETVLRRLMQHGLVVRMIRVRNKDQARSDPNTIIYQQGKPYDFFTLILEGRVEVIVGRENLVFESGPFTHFGSQALTGVNMTVIGTRLTQFVMLLMSTLCFMFQASLRRQSSCSVAVSNRFRLRYR